MRKIINGKLYDTGTAKQVGRHCSPLSVTDFYYFEETLFKKRTGEFFLFGGGNAASKYAERCGTGWTGGTGFVPLTEEEARDWAETYLDADDYIAIFGEVQE